MQQPYDTQKQTAKKPTAPGLLGGSWVVLSRVIIRMTIVITHIKGLIPLLIATHEPPSIQREAEVGSDNPQPLASYESYP